MKKYVWAVIFALWNTIAFGQEIFLPDAIKKTVAPVKINTDLKIDGFLTEPEWQQAAIISNLVQTDPVQGLPAKRKTVIRVLYNKDHLYFGITCYDTVGRNQYRTLNLKRDFSAANSDFFALAIDGYNDERNCIMFGMNPYGVQRDLLAFDDTYTDPDWDGLWTLRTQRTDTAWVAEVAIPWKTIRYKKGEGKVQTMGISFARIARSINESSNWPAIPRAFDGLRMPYAAKLINVETLPPATNIRVTPYTLFSRTTAFKDANRIAAKNTFKPGGDLAWSINPNTLLNLTVNTDFAQADVDMLVNNSNRFSILYPEKRQFFLENSGLFSVGLNSQGNGLTDYSTIIQPFFSRSIGLDGNGTPLNINAGARLVYRSDDQNIGGLYINQGGNDLAKPANFLATRYSKNIGSQSRIGGLLSYKAMGTGNSNTQNYTGSIDGFFRFGQRLSWSAMVSGTRDNTRLNGYAASSQLLYNSNTLSWWYNQSVVTRNYDPQMGFVARGNVLVTDPGLQYQLRGKWLPSFVRAIVPGAAFTFYHNATTHKLTDRYINLNPLYLQFQDGGVISYAVVLTKQVLDAPFTPLGTSIIAGTYQYTRHRLSFTSDLSKKIAGELVLDAGGYYNGKYNSIAAAVSFAPVPYFYTSPKIQLGRLNGVGEMRGSKNVTLFSVQQRLALNPRVQLSGVYQRSSVGSTEGWNARFAWEFKPLSFFYLVYNNNAFNDGTTAIPSSISNRQFIAKLSYLRQF
jgi:hypothetical protein